MKNKKQLSFKIPTGVHTQLKKLSKKLGRSVSAQANIFLSDAVLRLDTNTNTEAAK